MTAILVDSNVILDVVTEDPQWGRWSAETLARCAEGSILFINPIIYAEVSIGFDRIEDLDAAVPGDFFRRADLPWEAGFLAGKCFLRYRREGGKRLAPLPGFLHWRACGNRRADAAYARRKALQNLLSQTSSRRPLS